MSDRYDDDFDVFDPYEDLTDLSGTEGIPALEDPMIPQATPPRSPLLMGLIVGLLLVVLSIAAFQLIGQDDDDEATAPTTTSTAAPGTSDTTDATGSTGTTADSATTSAPPSSVVLDLPEFTASGNPVDIADLSLQVGAIGPIELGTGAPRAIGRLIASLGPPDEDSGAVESNGDSGACVGDIERLVRWGPLVAVVIVDDDGSQTFGGYRLDLESGGFSSPAADLKTLSGLKLGNSIERLESIYEGFDITYKPHPDLNEIFELRSANTGNLLLWGPLGTSEGSGGYIRGIYSPDACGRFSQ